jgi:hypothetical protein
MGSYGPEDERPRRWDGKVGPDRRILGLTVFAGGLGLLTAWLHSLGAGPLAAPPAAPTAWSAWVGSSDPFVATMALLRLGLHSLCSYQLVVTVIGITARLVRAARLVRLAAAVSLPPVRRLLGRALGVSLATVVVTAGLPSASGPAMAHFDTVAPFPLELLGGHAEPDPSEPWVPLEDPGASQAPALHGPKDEDLEAPLLRVVRSGESFWSIASDALQGAWGRRPADPEVMAYWREIIERNRHGLADPGNPDLIFPGQELRLPDVPDRPDGAGS